MSSKLSFYKHPLLDVSRHERSLAVHTSIDIANTEIWIKLPSSSTHVFIQDLKLFVFLWFNQHEHVEHDVTEFKSLSSFFAFSTLEWIANSPIDISFPLPTCQCLHSQNDFDEKLEIFIECVILDLFLGFQFPFGPFVNHITCCYENTLSIKLTFIRPSPRTPHNGLRFNVKSLQYDFREWNRICSVIVTI